MRVFTVSFFGHRYIEDPFSIEKSLEELLSTLLRSKEYVEFLVGRDGEFDQMVSSTIRRCKRKWGNHNSAHIWVLPYPTALFRNNEDAFREYYDEIEICDSASVSHFKSAYQIRNREMVDRSHLIVFCVQHPHGGAYQTMQYAIQQKKDILNLYQGEASKWQKE